MLLYNLVLTPNNACYIANVAIHRLFFYLKGQNDPSSEPLISGDSFRSLANLVLDKRCSFDPSEVKERDLIFVSSDHLEKFFSEFHPKIKNHYILISHNGDLNIDENLTKNVDSKIIKWYAQNVMAKHSKIVPIPIGLENLDYYNHGVPSFFSRENLDSETKKPLILYGFSESTNPKVRKLVKKQMLTIPSAEAIPVRLNSKEYVKLLKQYMFVASPPGNGVDCHRTWEALYCRTVPIVLRSKAMEYFVSIGVPLWVIDDYKELLDYSDSDFVEKYSLLMKHSRFSTLSFSFWKSRILKGN